MRDFSGELRRRLEENKRLYGERSPFAVFQSPFGRFVASQLGVNPWKVLIPTSAALVLLLRVAFGAGFSELVLRVLGGR